MVAVDSLIPYARNARTHSEDQVAQIAASIAEFGFTNPNRVEFRAINLDVLEQLATAHGITSIGPLEFQQFGLAGKNDLIKILGRGELKAKLDVKVHAFSGTAKAAIENAGGTAVTL